MFIALSKTEMVAVTYPQPQAAIRVSLWTRNSGVRFRVSIRTLDSSKDEAQVVNASILEHAQ